LGDENIRRISWSEIIIALAVQTIVGGLIFYSSTIRFEAQMEERFINLRRDVDQNSLEHKDIIKSCKEYVQEHEPR
jgi:hypothetical protein